MKTTTNAIWLLLCFLMIASTCFSQETAEEYEKRKIEMLKEEQKITTFLKSEINQPLPQEELKLFKSSIEHINEDRHEGEPEITLTENQKEELFLGFKKNYWRKQYFKQNTGAALIYKPKVAAGSCDNGGFEIGDFTGYAGYTAYGADGYDDDDNPNYSPNCELTAEDFNFTPIPLVSAHERDFKIMDVGADPVVTAISLNQVWTGDHSIRINSNLGTPTSPSPTHSVSRLTKEVILSEVNEVIYFRYALVMANPTGHDDSKPTFKATAYDASGVACDNICTAAIIVDPHVDYAVTGSTSIVYKDWACGELQTCGDIGDVVTLEFLMTDCGQGAHWGYAYIDDICDTCVADPCNNSGSIYLNPTDTCIGDVMNVCGTYNLAALNCESASAEEIRLYIYQDGVEVAGPFIDSSPSGGTFCFTVDPSFFPGGGSGGYDFYTEIDFDFGVSGSSTQNNIHSNPGLNNDYIFDAQCCPEFELKTCCDLINPSKSTNFIDPVALAIIEQHNTSMSAKYANKSTNGVYDCCSPCNYPTDSFPVFIFGEDGMLVDATSYTITWSHDPSNTGSFAYLFPNQETIVTVAGPDSCVWQDTFIVSCCSDTITINPFCAWDPCDYPNVAIPFNVQDQGGNILSAPEYTFVWSNGSTSNTTSDVAVNLPISVVVSDTNGCVYSDTFDLDCCRPDVALNLLCTSKSNGSELSWDPVLGAVSYLVYISVDDPNCCQGTGLPYSLLPVSVTSPNHFVSTITADCFSWAVVAICENGDRSAESERVCSCNKVTPCVIEAPRNLSCQLLTTGQYLSWGAVAGAVSYELTIYYGDPDCCPQGSQQSISMPISVATNSYIVTTSECFSWTVIAICEDGTQSVSSNKQCSCNRVTSCVIEAPQNLSCQLSTIGQFLSWSSVAGAAGYELTIHYGDPACCPQGSVQSISIPISVATNSYVVATSQCFSWTVIAICADGTKSASSNRQCSCNSNIIKGNKKGSIQNQVNYQEFYATAIPNPAKDVVTINLYNHEETVEITNAKIVILDFSGKEVYKSTISVDEAKRINVSSFKSGIYVYNIIYEGVVISSNKLIIQ